MHRIDSPDNDNGKFTDGNPEQGVEATVIWSKWLNAVQEEIAHFIEEAGLELDDTDNGQLYTALIKIFNDGLSLGNSDVHGSGSGANSSATLHHDKLGVAATGDVATELHAEFLKFIRGQKTAQIGTKIVSNNIVVTIDEIVEFAKNVVVNGYLSIGVDGSDSRPLTRITSAMVGGVAFMKFVNAVRFAAAAVFESAAQIAGDFTANGNSTFNGATNFNNAVTVAEGKTLKVVGDETYEHTGLVTPSMKTITSAFDMSNNVADWTGLVDGERVIVWNNGGNGAVTLSWKAPDGGSKSTSLAEDYGIEFVCYSASEKTFVALKG